MRFFTSLCLCALLCSLPTHAQESDLFQVDWPVSDRSRSTQQQAFVDAFKEVIVRASGSEQALDAFYVQESYKKVSSFVRTYEYQSRDIPVSDSENASEQSEQTQLFLAVQFDANAVQRLLQDAAVPMWSGSRPVTLMWLAYEQDYNRQVVATSTPMDQPVKHNLMQQMHRRGLPVVLPLMDLEDEMRVSASDIWGRFPEPVINASSRYGSDSVVAGRVLQQSDSWQGRFMLQVDDQQHYMDFEAAEQAELMRQLSDWVGEQLCQVFCVTESFSVNNQWQVIVQDVGSFYSYRKLMDYFESLSAIRKVEVSKTKGRSLMVTVDLVGEIDSLIQAIDLDRNLVPVEDQFEIQQAISFMKKAAPMNSDDPFKENRLNGNADNQDELNRQSAGNSDNSNSSDNSNKNPLTPMVNSQTNTAPFQAEKQTEQKILVYLWRP